MVKYIDPKDKKLKNALLGGHATILIRCVQCKEHIVTHAGLVDGLYLIKCCPRCEAKRWEDLAGVDWRLWPDLHKIICLWKDFEMEKKPKVTYDTKESPIVKELDKKIEELEDEHDHYKKEEEGGPHDGKIII